MIQTVISRRQKTRQYVDKFLHCSFIRFVDLPYHLANHIIGTDHTPVHRKSIGVLVMISGALLIGMINTISHCMILHVVGELTGNSIHAIGFLPFIKDVEENVVTKSTSIV